MSVNINDFSVSAVRTFCCVFKPIRRISLKLLHGETLSVQPRIWML